MKAQYKIFGGIVLTIVGLLPIVLKLFSYHTSFECIIPIPWIVVGLGIGIADFGIVTAIVTLFHHPPDQK